MSTPPSSWTTRPSACSCRSRSNASSSAVHYTRTTDGPELLRSGAERIEITSSSATSRGDRRSVRTHRKGDLGAAAKHQHPPSATAARRLHLTASQSPRRRARSERMTPCGSTSPSGAKALECRIHRRQGFPAASCVLAEVHATAGARYDLVELIRAARRPGAPAGMSTASVQPCNANESGPPNRGPNR